MPRGPAAASARQAILDAALELFSSRGFSATTIEDVREASGASTGSIYHHFGSKEGLAAALFLEGLSGFQRRAVEVYAAHPAAEEGVRAVVHLYLEWVAEHPSLARFLLTSRAPSVRSATDPELRELNRRFFAATAAWREANIDAGAIRPLSADMYLAIVVGPAQAFARGWLAGRTQTPIEEATEALADAAWRAVRPDGGA